MSDPGEIKRLRERIEELELQDERMIPDGCCLVTTDQIDAAWQSAGEFDNGIEVLENLGIVRCDWQNGRCQGNGWVMGKVKGGDRGPGLHKCECPGCNGHGWVIGGEDE